MTESPTVPPPDKVWPVLTTLLDCLCPELEASPGGAPCFCGVVPGALVAMDFCDCDDSGCGMAWVRLDSVFPSRQFPSPITDARCGDPLAVRVQVGVTRCVPGMDAQGNPPSVEAQAAAVLIQSGDAAAIRRAIVCCTDSWRKYVLGEYVPIGPAANCGGGAWTVTVQVM